MTEPQEPRSAASIHLTPDELSECAFSPETAAAGWLEHAQGCAECAAGLADLRLVLDGLAGLPEPELPQSVGIRLDAAVARAWQEADAERESAAAHADAARTRRGGRRSWRRLAVPLGSLALIAAAVAGLGVLLTSGSTNSASSSSTGVVGASPFTPQSNSTATELSLGAWVQSVLPANAADADASPGSAGSTSHDVERPNASSGQAQIRCPSVPQRAGYTVLATAEGDFRGTRGTLVVYQNAKEPASNTVYAVVYAGSCPTTGASILDQGPVGR